MEYILYCDESKERGNLHSNFYGGSLVSSLYRDEVVQRLEDYKYSQGINDTEMKWTKVTSQFLDKYIGLMDVFFDLINENKIKTRIMFQQNLLSDPVIRKFDKEEKDESYFKLYYQFIKHAFGLKYSNPSNQKIHLRLFFDQFPDKKEKVDKFKGFIYNLQFSQEFHDANLHIRYEDIVEAVSHNHVILQCTDIITGAMYFRLNKLNEKKDPQTNRRGKRTIAKEKLYNHIRKRICETRPRFNIGESTGIDGNIANRWNHPYRHWKFVPSEVANKRILHF